MDCRGWVHMDDSLSLHRKRRPNRVLATLALTATAALIAAACSGGAESTTGERPDLPVAESSSESPLPQVTVWDVGESEWVQFADLIPSDKPVLLWFWAPHCPACAAEAPGMREFAESHADELDVIGIGTQDDPVMAQEFVDRHGIAFPMLWDETFETWNAFGITAQPATVLFDGGGTVLEGWMGGLPEERVLELIEDPTLATT